MDKKNKIVFLSGTRADFGKIKSLVQIMDDDENFEVHIFVTGMHMQSKYGNTVIEIENCKFSNIYKFINTTSESSMDLSLAKTIEGLSNFVNEINPDLIIVHGDRPEALAGAIVGALNNILVGHIEGGEVSGTIDELIRHSVSKLCHAHFVVNQRAKQRLIQMGEDPISIFTIGSPDVDIILSPDLPSLQDVKEYYEIEFNQYALLMFHPVTTEYEKIKSQAKIFVDSILDSTSNYVAIYPNNDLGSRTILEEYERFKAKPNIKLFPSLRFEFFLVLLKKASFIIGNSSSGIMEAPYYGTPTINIGSRQQNRTNNKNIINTNFDKIEILEAIQAAYSAKVPNSKTFGTGEANVKFREILRRNEFWNLSRQKLFKDIILN